MNYSGVVCPVCKKPLQNGEDIVVCPDCGTPYHRACYAQEGACVHAHEHGTYEFKREETVPQRRCPNCGADNPESNLFCENCGVAIGEKQVQPQAAAQGAAGQEFAGAAWMNGVPEPLREAMGGTAGAAGKEYDGIKAHDWADYIGKSAPYYLFQFERMNQTGRKTSICWSALFLWPLYFFYRKVWGWAAVGVLAFALTNTPTVLLMLQELGVLTLGMNVGVLTGLSYVCMVLDWAVRIFFGLYGFYLFRQHAGKKIKALQQDAPEEAAFHARLVRAGGTSVVAVVLMVILMMGISMAFSIWIGPQRLMNYLYY